jgi:hypothetical protein
MFTVRNEEAGLWAAANELGNKSVSLTVAMNSMVFYGYVGI